MLVKFSFEDDLPDLAKEDLMNENVAIGKAKNELERPPKEPIKDSYSYALNNPGYNRVICSALKCYLKDLEKSMEKISGLYDDAKIPLSLTHADLQLVKEALTKIPDCEYTSDENE
jgi:septation ring formation regulator EzrA